MAAGQAIRLLASLLNVTLLVAALSPSDAGRMFVLLAATRLLAPLVTLGAGDLTLRYLQAGAALRTAFAVTQRRSLLTAAILAAPTAVLLGTLTGKPGWVPVYLVGAVFMPLAQSLRTVGYSALLWRGLHSRAAASEGVRGATPAAVTAALVVSGASDGVLVLGLTLAPVIVGAPLAALSVRWAATSGSSPTARIAATGVGYSLRVALGATMRATYESVDQLMLPLFVSLTVSRAYGLAASVVYAAMALVASAGEVWTPRLYGAPAPSPREARRYMALAGATSTVGALVLGGVIALWLRDPAVMVLVATLSGVLLARSQSFLPLAWLTARGSQTVRNWIEGIGGVGNALLNLVAIPLLGGLGAAASSVAAEAWTAAAADRAAERQRAGR